MNQLESADQEVLKLLVNELIKLIESNEDNNETTRTKKSFLVEHLDLEYLKNFVEIDEHFVNDLDDSQDFDSNGGNSFYEMSYSKCDSCQTRTSVFWRKVARAKIVCNNCFFNKTYLIVFDDNYTINGKKLKLNEDYENEILDDSNGSKLKNRNSKPSGNNKSLDVRTITTRNLINSIKPAAKIKVEEEDVASLSDTTSKSNDSVKTNDSVLRKSSRSTTLKKKANDTIKEEENDSSEGKYTENNKTSQANGVSQQSTTNRRTKKFKLETAAPLKCETLVSRVVTSDYVFHRGFYLQIGDIVALFDKEDTETIYFAKIRAFLTDQCGQKSAVITWLIPINNNYKSVKLAKDFDPSLFRLGPSEEFPRELDCMEFVCRLVDQSEKFKPLNDDYVYSSAQYQYENDLLKQKFFLQDLDDSKFRIITKRSYLGNTNQIENHHVEN